MSFTDRLRFPDKPFHIYTLAAIREGEYLAQKKLDGWNSLLVKEAGKLIVLRRDMRQQACSKELLAALETLDLKDGDVLNGEWTCRRKANREEAMWLFDVMYLGHEWIGNQTTVMRYARLWDMLEGRYNGNPPEHLHLIDSVTTDYANFYRSTIDDWKTEGIVLKHKEARLIGDPNKSKDNPRMFKLKWRDGPDGMTKMVVPDDKLICKGG
jgi:hypothetical protein